MRPLLLLLFFILCTSVFAQPVFTARISFGIEVPVYNWNGHGDVLEFAINSLDSADNQGTLVILGRDAKSIWCIEAGYDNDASEDGFFMNLVRVDPKGEETKYAPVQLRQRDTTFTQRFRRMYESYFRKYNLQKLNPVSVWMSPYAYDFVAQVNCKELDCCIQWNLLVDSEDNGSCVFYFEWGATSSPYQLTRIVGIYQCFVTIPSDWYYHVNEDSSGAILGPYGTLFFGLCADEERLHEKTEYNFPFDSEEDSVRWTNYNAKIQRHNDSLRMTYPTASQNTIYGKQMGYGHLTYFMPRDTGSLQSRIAVYSVGVGFHEGDFYMITGLVDPAGQKAFRAVVESAEERW